MTKAEIELKPMTIRLPKDLWVFLKTHGFNEGVTLSEVIIRCLKQYKNKLEEKAERKKGR